MDDQASKKGEAVLHSVNLHKKYGAFTAVESISLKIQQGEVFGFLGPNGAGKTTTINMMCGLLKPTSGEVYIYGKKIKDQETVKSVIGVCPQENIFWPKLTCREQLMFMGEAHGLKARGLGKKVNELLEKLGLTEKANVLASKLSGGMKRRLNICLALVHDPSIVIFDEPEAGLDPQSRILVRDFIRSLARQKTIVLTTHNMDEADRLSDRVAIIDHGKLLMLDTPEKLKNAIGEGDVLELELPGADESQKKNVEGFLKQDFEQLAWAGETLVLKAKNLVGKMAKLVSDFEKHQIAFGDMKLRENSLEDVFIHLTGRKLRQ